MRSGTDPFIREAIVGHSLKKKDVPARYLSLEDEDLVKAIDGMTFGHGETKIWIARKGKNPPGSADGQRLRKSETRSHEVSKPSDRKNRK
jgi:hypothetical protein